jgi:hypothetical protein
MGGLFVGRYATGAGPAIRLDPFYLVHKRKQLPQDCPRAAAKC